MGVEMKGWCWYCFEDCLVFGLVFSGFSDIYVRYLVIGGFIFQFGDGGFRYGWEVVLESYYVFVVFFYFEFSLDVQVILNSGMNVDRGFIVVFGICLYVYY